MRTVSWIEPNLDWSAPTSGQFAYLASVRDDSLVGLIADNGITVRVGWKPLAEITFRREPSLRNALELLVSVPEGPGWTDQTVTFRLCDLLKTAEGQLVVVLGREKGPSYSQTHPEHERIARERVRKYQADCEAVKRADEKLKRELKELWDRHPDFEEAEKFREGTDFMVDYFGPNAAPEAPRLSDLGLQLEEVGFVPALPESATERLRVVMEVVASSGRGVSRNGRYDCTPITTTDETQAAIVRWTPRWEMPPTPELKAALERRFPSALLKPRRPDCMPPEPLDGEDEFSPGAIPDVGADTDSGDLANRVEATIASMGGVHVAREYVRRALRERGFEGIGWYQAFHKFGEPVWGIHLDTRKLDFLAFSLGEELWGAGQWRYRLGIELAVRLVTAHELFHARVEFAATWLELSSHRRRYLPYVQNIYEASRGTSEWLEEALANWCARDWLELNLGRLQSIGLVQYPETVIRVVEDWLDFSPPGYSDWRVGHDYPSWRRLAAELATSRPHPEQSAKAALPLEALLRTETLFDLRLGDIPIFFHGTGVVADIYFSSPSRREVLRVLNQRGYCPEAGRGKGSHQVWRGPDGRIFAVPARDPLSVGVFHRLLAHFGMTKQQYLREVR